MKRCHFNSKLAEILLLENYTAITFFFHSFFKKGESEVPKHKVNHEMIHQHQQIECTIIGLFLSSILRVIFDMSFWWMLVLTFGFFYIWYLGEYLLIHLFAKQNSQGDRYHDIGFEEEAYIYEKDLEYLKKRVPFSWLKYTRLRSYRKKKK